MAIAQSNTIIRAARIRAAVNAFLYNTPLKKTFREVAVGIESTMEEFDYNDDSLRAMLTSMVNNGLIKSEKIEDRVYYSASDTDQPARRRFEPRLVGQPDLPTTKPNEFLFDIVRSSGHLRITHNGAREEFKFKGPLKFKVGDNEVVINLVID